MQNIITFDEGEDIWNDFYQITQGQNNQKSDKCITLIENLTGIFKL